MINANFKKYNYFTIGEKNTYGQEVMPTKDSEPVGEITMAIHLSSKSILDDINYAGANYIGLTHAKVDDTYIIEYGEERLKVLYVTPGRLNQVFMRKI